jgi:hypothetical protein
VSTKSQEGQFEIEKKQAQEAVEFELALPN